MNEHNREYVKSFFSDIAAWSEACSTHIVSYVAFRGHNGFELAKARVFFEMRPRDIEKAFYEFENIQAGVFHLSDLKMTPEEFIEELEKGNFPATNRKLSFAPKGCHDVLTFLPEGNGGFSAYYNPYHNEGLETGNRLSLLSVMGGPSSLQPRYTELDWELKSAKKPFDNVQELLFELSLGTVDSSKTEVEFIAANCLRPDRSEPYRSIQSTKAQPAFIIPNTLEKAKTALGFRLIHQGKVIRRERIDGSGLKWEEVENELRASKKIKVPEGAVMHCVGSYADKAQQQWWLSDPSTTQNPLRAAYNTFDEDLDVLNAFLEVGKDKGQNARNLETAIAWLLWMLGFKVAHLGLTKKTQEAPDLIATTNDGHFLVIECTTGQLKADHKLTLLIERTETLRKGLAASGNGHLKALPVIVTTKTRKDVLVDVEPTEKLGVLIITKEEISNLLNRSLVLPNAEKIYLEAEQIVKEAQEKHSPGNRF